jgi:hypothetical protein
MTTDTQLENWGKVPLNIRLRGGVSMHPSWLDDKALAKATRDFEKRNSLKSQKKSLTKSRPYRDNSYLKDLVGLTRS